jgi:hypothetical protein
VAVTRAATDAYAGPSSAGAVLSPIIDFGLGDGVPAAMSGTYNTDGVYGGYNASTSTYMGYRFATGGIDLSTRQLIGWSMAQNSLSRGNLSSVANGGLRIAFSDGTNWFAYNVFGGDVAPYTGSSSGGFSGYAGLGANDQSVNACWFLDRDTRATAATSGALNWASVTHIEIHFRSDSAGTKELAMGHIITAGLPLFTGTATNSLFEDGRSAYTTGGTYVFPWVFRPTPEYSLSSLRSPETIQLGVQIGDGSTTTTLTESDVNVTYWGRFEDYTPSNSVPPNSSILIDTPRLFDFYQSATDTINMSDFFVSSTSMIGLRVRGSTSGTLNLTRWTITNFELMELAHGNFVSCSFVEGLVPVEITADTSASGSFVRDSYGIKITGAAGDYSALGIDLLDNTTHDIEAGAGGAGTYDLTGLTIPSGYTLKVHNDSATNAITVSLPPGTTTTTSTAGGSITIDTAVTVTVSITALNESLTAISGAAVYLEAATGGPLPYQESVSLVRSGSTATVTHTAHGLSTADEIKIRGCDQSAYNIAASITVTSVNAYTYAVSGTPTTPATGTPTATSVILNGDTNGSGILQDTSFTYTTDQPVSGTTRKATSSPFYRASSIVGTITDSGFASSVILVGDE